MVWSEGELIKDLLLPTQPRTWRRQAGGQLKTRATTLKADLETLSGPRLRPRTMEKRLGENVSSELAQHRRARSASVRDVVTQLVMPAQPTPDETKSLLDDHSIKKFNKVNLPRLNLHAS